MNSRTMLHQVNARHLVRIASVVLLCSVHACSDNPNTESSAAAAKGATPSPSPFAARSSRLIEVPKGVGTPIIIGGTSAADSGDDDGLPPDVRVYPEADPDSGGAPLTVNFTVEVEGAIPGLRYTWDFGDGTGATHEFNVQHTYREPGEYTATFSVRGEGVDESREIGIEVTEEGFDLDIQADPDVGPAPLTVQFEALVDDDLPGPMYFQWDFGDGGRDFSRETRHTYRAPGEYTVTLAVQNGQGQSAMRDVTITVDPKDDN